MKSLTAILLAGVLAGGCATTGGAAPGGTAGRATLDKYQPYLGEPVKSFTALQKDSWQPISRTQLVLWTTINEAYLLTVEGRGNHDLPFTQTGRRDLDDERRSRRSTRCIVRGDRCPITQIQPIDVRRMKADKNARAAEEAALNKP